VTQIDGQRSDREPFVITKKYNLTEELNRSPPVVYIAGGSAPDINEAKPMSMRGRSSAHVGQIDSLNQKGLSFSLHSLGGGEETRSRAF
jgi:hypothetical protein